MLAFVRRSTRRHIWARKGRLETRLLGPWVCYKWPILKYLSLQILFLWSVQAKRQRKVSSQDSIFLCEETVLSCLIVLMVETNPTIYMKSIGDLILSLSILLSVPSIILSWFCTFHLKLCIKTFVLCKIACLKQCWPRGLFWIFTLCPVLYFCKL